MAVAACVLTITAQAAIIPQAIQIHAEEALVLRIESVERLSALPQPAPPGTDREIVVVRGTVDATLWSRSGLLTGNPILLKIALDPQDAARRVERSRRNPMPGPQVLHTSAPASLLQPTSPGSPPRVRAFLNSSTRRTLAASVTRWGPLPSNVTDEIARDPVFFAPGAHQYSLQSFFFMGDEWPGLAPALQALQETPAPHDVALLYAPTRATAYEDDPETTAGQSTQLPPGTTLEWLGPVTDDPSQAQWAYAGSSGTLYHLHPAPGHVPLAHWVLRTVNLSDPRLRATAEAHALAEKNAVPPARAFAARQRLKHLHTRLETLAAGDLRNS